MEKKFVVSDNGKTVYYTNESTAEKTIVFTHGLIADHTVFEKQVEFFAGKYKLIIWDIPTHGLSSPYENFSYESAASELNLILEQENLPEVILVGMSVGGYVCQEFARRYPEKTSGFIALGTTPFGLQYYTKRDKWRIKHTGVVRRLLPEGMLKKSMVRKSAKSPYGRQIFAEILKEKDKQFICERTKICCGKFLEENRDAEFDFPVTVLLGEKDKAGKIQQYNKQWSENTGYPLVIIPKARHMANCDNPEIVNTAIYRFVQNVYLKRNRAVYERQAVQ